MKLIRLIGVLGFAAVSACAAPSTWVFYGGDGKLQYQAWGNGNRIMDFSTAGYMGGGVALPDVPTVQTLNPSGGDDKTAIQNAINAVAAMPLVNGVRGALQLAPGTFRISGQITITASGVVLRGSGSGPGGTIILMTNAASFSAFHLTGSGSPSTSGKVNITGSYVPSGTNGFDVSSASGFNVGDNVQIGRVATSNWIHFVGMDTLVRSGATQTWISVGSTIKTDRTIKQVSGNHITLDAPLTDSFDSVYLGTPVGTMSHYSWSGRISQVGLEHLQIVAPPVASGYSAVSLDDIIDSWVRDVTIQDGVNNVDVSGSGRRVTVDSVVITHTVVQTASAAPADFACTGSQVLFNKCQSFGTGSWPFITRSEGTGPIVFLNCFTSQDRGVAPHERWTTGILADNCQMPHAQSSGSKEGIAYGNRGTDGSGHGWTTGWSVGWNVTSPYLLADAAPGSENWCIGCVGAKGSSSDPHGIYESLGTKVDLGQTGSLYLEQLRERLGNQALANIGYGDPVTVSVTPAQQAVLPGNSVSYSVSVTSSNAFTNTVFFGATNLPIGVSASFSPATITGPGATTLTLFASNGAPYTLKSFSVTAVASNFNASASASIFVGDFLISASPASQIAVHGTPAIYTVTLSTNSAFTGSVSFDLSGLPPGAVASFNPPSLTGAGSSTLTVTTSTNDPGGAYVLTISGVGGALSGTNTASVNLNVTGDIAAPGVLFWKGTNNWSTALNWTNVTIGGAGAPGPGSLVVFTNLAPVTTRTVNNIVDNSSSIASLQYANNAVSTSPNYHVTQINDGQTLTVTNGLFVGTANDAGGGQVVNAVITGANGTLVLSNGIFSVTQGSTTAGAHQSTLDLSGLGTLNATVSKLGIAVYQFPPQAGNGGQRSSGVLYLARTNVIQVSSTGVTNSLLVGWNDSQGNNGVGDKNSVLYLGQNNSIFADTIYVGTDKTLGCLLAFNPTGLSGPSALFRNRDGVSRVSSWGIGDTSMKNNSNQNASGTNDFSGGAIDAMIGTLSIGVTTAGAGSGPSTGNGTGTLTFDTGTIDVNNVTNGWSLGTSTAAGTDIGSGTMNVNGTALLKVNNTFALAQNTAAGTGVPIGSLNVNGGTVQAANIVGGAGVSTINLTRGTIDLAPGFALVPGSILNLSSLNIGAVSVPDPAVLLDAAAISTTNTITIAPNGALVGNTVLTDRSLVVNGTLSPGDGVGAMTNNGAVIFGASGHLTVELNDAAAGPGVGWDFLQVSGGINVQASSGSPFAIDLVTLDSDEAGQAANFNNAVNYQWPIASTTGAVTNFDATRFVINTAQFQNDTGGGSFSLRTNGNTLLLCFTHAAATGPVAISGVAVTGNSLVLNASNGVPNAVYYVLASTNLALPLSNWTAISTGAFDGAGNLSFTNTVDPAAVQRFFLLQMP
jgi:hypothetical protein